MNELDKIYNGFVTGELSPAVLCKSVCTKGKLSLVEYYKIVPGLIRQCSIHEYCECIYQITFSKFDKV